MSRCKMKPNYGKYSAKTLITCGVWLLTFCPSWKYSIPTGYPVFLNCIEFPLS